MMNASYNNVNILIRDACDTGILSHTMFRLRVVVSGRRPTKNGHGMVPKKSFLGQGNILLWWVLTMESTKMISILK